jgi:hypothetical protein
MTCHFNHVLIQIKYAFFESIGVTPKMGCLLLVWRDLLGHEGIGLPEGGGMRVLG